MQVITYIRSKLMKTYIEISRVIDHTWRRSTGRPRARRSMITPQVYLGGQYKESGLKTLHSWGITAVVSMRMHKPVEYLGTDWLSVLHLPTPDQTAPSMMQLQEGVAFIQEHLSVGGKVYIHCHHGEGRGPTMTAAYLISTGMTLDDALNEICTVRNFIRPTKVQIARLKEFEEKAVHTS